MSESKYHRLTDIKEVKNDEQTRPTYGTKTKQETNTSVNFILGSLVASILLLLTLNIIKLAHIVARDNLGPPNFIFVCPHLFFPHCCTIHLRHCFLRVCVPV